MKIEPGTSKPQKKALIESPNLGSRQTSLLKDSGLHTSAAGMTKLLDISRNLHMKIFLERPRGHGFDGRSILIYNV